MATVYHLNRETRRKAKQGIRLPKKNNTLLSVAELREISKEVDSLKNIDYSELIVPLVVLFDCPVDYPDDIVARVFNLDNPTNMFVRYETIDDARKDAVEAGFSRLIPRDEKDPPYIIETYM